MKCLKMQLLYYGFVSQTEGRTSVVFSKPFPVRPRKVFMFLLFKVKLKSYFIEGKNYLQQNTSQIVIVSEMAKKKISIIFQVI